MVDDSISLLKFYVFSTSGFCNHEDIHVCVYPIYLNGMFFWVSLVLIWKNWKLMTIYPLFYILSFYPPNITTIYSSHLKQHKGPFYGYHFLSMSWQHEVMPSFTIWFSIFQSSNPNNTTINQTIQNSNGEIENKYWVKTNEFFINFLLWCYYKNHMKIVF